MRSAAEVKFRLHQEAANLYLLWRKPAFTGDMPERLALPDEAQIAEALRGTEYARQVEALAGSILKHRFPMLGVEIDTGVNIRWRRDYEHQRESELAYFRRIPYLDFQTVGDHKLVWELNRHQHLVLLAQAYVLTQQREYIEELSRQLQAWLAQNPFQEGINWTSALEVAFRTLSWIWVYHLVSGQLSPELRRSLVSSLYQHGLHLAHNLSVYFSPNTHLLGEAVALFVLATLFPQLPGASGWSERSKQIVIKQLEFQVKQDGSHFEQSTYYHVYAVDFFVLFYIVAGRPSRVKPVLLKMAEYLYWLLGPAREISFFGDDDGGRLFHPYGVRSRFGRATIATCGALFEQANWGGTEDDLAEHAVWWLGAESLSLAKSVVPGTKGWRVFSDSGSVFAQAGEFWLQMDCGPFGFGGAGHSHSDTLSLILRFRGEAILIDPGTFTYISDVAARNWFRGSGAHNSVRVDGRDQADPVNPFRWSGKPKVKLSRVGEASGEYFIDGYCEYQSVKHRRRLLMNEHRLLILDELDCGDGEHVLEQIWQLGPSAGGLHLYTSAKSEMRSSAYSPAYGQKLEGRSVVATERGRSPFSMAMLLTQQQTEGITVDQANEMFTHWTHNS